MYVTITKHKSKHYDTSKLTSILHLALPNRCFSRLLEMVHSGMVAPAARESFRRGVMA